ncbi:SDR family oxidoreductase [Sphingomonas sp. RB1R13]|uniref:SDR family oxidoreductase n=1 Tax=Sphingomonas sp. RB1R13 TaxID=3096159 RepID=UPI002FCAA8F8
MARTLIVTGGSRGIGAACARLGARAGWSVCLSYRANEAAAAAVVHEIEQAGGRALAIASDVSSELNVTDLFDRAEKAFGEVTGLINNAGILASASTLANIELSRWTATLATNLTGTFLCAREAVRRMAVSAGGAGGSIVNVSSMAAVLGAPSEFIDYAASKGAIDALTIGLAKEVAADGIRVNGVRPGLIDTGIHESSGDPSRAKRLAPTVPMQRTGTTEEVARTILWLLSDDASYCTGVTINVSGGR